MSTAHSPLLVLKDVSLSRHGKSVLCGVNLSIRPGEIVALAGPNGAGKSTLLAVASGDLTPNQGRVLIDSLDCAGMHAKELAQKRSFLTQHNDVGFSFTSREVIEMGRAPWSGHGSWEDSEKAIDEAVAACEVDHLLDREFQHLSGGEKARVSLARIIAQQTPLIFLDEPTAALDVKHQEHVRQICQKKAADGCAVVIVVHDLSFAAAVGSRVVLVQDGTIVADDEPSAVLNPSTLEEVYGYPMHCLDGPDGYPLIVPAR